MIVLLSVPLTIDETDYTYISYILTDKLIGSIMLYFEHMDQTLAQSYLPMPLTVMNPLYEFNGSISVDYAICSTLVLDQEPKDIQLVNNEWIFFALDFTLNHDLLLIEYTYTESAIEVAYRAEVPPNLAYVKNITASGDNFITQFNYYPSIEVKRAIAYAYDKSLPGDKYILGIRGNRGEVNNITIRGYNACMYITSLTVALHHLSIDNNPDSTEGSVIFVDSFERLFFSVNTSNSLELLIFEIVCPSNIIDDIFVAIDRIPSPIDQNYTDCIHVEHITGFRNYCIIVYVVNGSLYIHHYTRG